jgi:MFS transporter, DHA1 family, multidrug resistance protein
MPSDIPARNNTPYVARARLGFWEFIALTAMLTSMVAMAIDIMLPVLPMIGQDLGIADVNRRQLIIVSFTLGFAISQLIFGPLTDRFGRRPLLLAGIALFVAMSIVCVLIRDFDGFLMARFVQGAGAAAVNIVVRAMIRDCFSGAAMGRVMSFSFTAFMIVPVIAPLLGQTVATFANWHWIFVGLALVATALGIWTASRLAETLPREERRSLSPGSLWSAAVEIATNRIAAGYTLAATLTSVALFAYIVSVQQVYGELYGLGTLFPFAFAVSSIGVAFASVINGRIVMVMGLKKVAHLTLISFTITGMLLFVLSLFFQPPFWLTFLLLSLSMMAFGVMQGNIGAISMEPLGHVAGMASSLIGVFSTTIGVLLGGLVGQAYNGTITPLAFAFGFSGLVSTLIVFWTERGRLFK